MTKEIFILDWCHRIRLPATRTSRSQPEDTSAYIGFAKNWQTAQQDWKHTHPACGLRVHRSGTKSSALHKELHREGIVQERGDERQNWLLQEVQEQFAAWASERVSSGDQQISRPEEGRINHLKSQADHNVIER